MSAFPDYVVIADPSSLRWQHYEPELRRFVAQFNPGPRVQVVPWGELIDAGGDLSRWAPGGPFLLRLESPARNFDIFRRLLQGGQLELGEPTTDWPYEEGWIASPRRVYLGFCRVLRQLEEWVRDHANAWPTSCLRDTRQLFDKNAVSERLSRNQIPTPDWFQPHSATDVYRGIATRGWKNAYLKLAFGSCASGIARLRRGQAPIQPDYRAETTMTRVDDRYFNTFRVQQCAGDALRDIIQFVVDETATVQRAVDKTTVHGDGFDLRVVVVNHEVAATVFRASPAPMTNLHLGGYRADSSTCRRTLTDRNWVDGLETCRRVSQLFEMASLGIDLAFDRRSGEAFVLEVNSFGDFFPNWTDSRGRSLHRIEIEATARRYLHRERIDTRGG